MGNEKGFDGGGAHQHGAPLTIEESLARHRARQADWALRPDTFETERLKAERIARRDAKRLAKHGGDKGLIGPPNPYKPHRVMED